MHLKSKANELFKAGKYDEAESAYQEGLKALKDSESEIPAGCINL